MGVPRSRYSPEAGRSAIRWAWRGLAVLAVVGICGITLYWTQSKVDAMSTRMAAMDQSLKVLIAQASSGPADSASVPQGAAAVDTPSSTVETVRLARIVRCETSGNLITVTYDPAQLFTGEDAVKLAASKGDAVTGDSYIFDPTRDLFTGDAPAKTAVIVHQVPAGWVGASPTTITELATALLGAQGQKWQDTHFWLHFNQSYLVSIEQYQTGDAQ